METYHARAFYRKEAAGSSSVPITISIEHNARRDTFAVSILGEFFFNKHNIEAVRRRESSNWDLELYNEGRLVRRFENCSLPQHGHIEMRDSAVRVERVEFVYNSERNYPDDLMKRLKGVSETIDREQVTVNKEPNTIKQQLDEAKAGREVVWKPRPINW